VATMTAVAAMAVSLPYITICAVAFWNSSSQRWHFRAGHFHDRSTFFNSVNSVNFGVNVGPGEAGDRAGHLGLAEGFRLQPSRVSRTFMVSISVFCRFACARSALRGPMGSLRGPEGAPSGPQWGPFGAPWGPFGAPWGQVV